MKNDKPPRKKAKFGEGSLGEALGPDFRPLGRKVKLAVPIDKTPLRRRGPPIKPKDR